MTFLLLFFIKNYINFIPASLSKQANCEYYVDTVGDERVIVNKQEIGEDEQEIEIDNTKTPGTRIIRSIFTNGPAIIKLFSCSTQPSLNFILLINVKMPTIVGILTLISMINTTSESLKERKVDLFFSILGYEKLKFRAQLS